MGTPATVTPLRDGAAHDPSSAAGIAASVAQGRLSATDILRERFALIDRRNPDVNALVASRRDEAMREAAAIDAARACGERMGPLAGVPVSVKESLDVAGMTSTAGLTNRAGHRATHDIDAVRRLRDAGAVIIGKSNLAQCLLYIESENPVHGRCNHPERADRSPGGSSGGEGALVAMGASTLGLGTDIGGSGRIPAAFCGVASMKPTAGRLPDPGRLSLPIGQYAIPSQLAAFARAAGDVEQMLGVLDPGTHRLDSSASVDVRTLRIGIYESDGLFATSPGVRRAVREAADALRRAGATVVEFRIPDPADVQSLFYSLLSADGMRGLKRVLRGSKVDARTLQLTLLGSRSKTFRSVVAALAAGLGQKHLPNLVRALGKRSVDEYWQLCERQMDYTDRFTAAMDQHSAGRLDLLLGPVAATPALTHGAAKDLGVPGVYTLLYNLLGWPAGVVPVSRVQPGEESDRGATRDLAERAALRVESGSAGLPLAVQTAARPWREHEAFAAMRAIERAVDFRL